MPIHNLVALGATYGELKSGRRVLVGAACWLELLKRIHTQMRPKWPKVSK